MAVEGEEGNKTEGKTEDNTTTTTTTPTLESLQAELARLAEDNKQKGIKLARLEEKETKEKTKRDEEERLALEKQNEFKTLYEKEKADREELLQDLRMMNAKSKVKDELAKHGAVAVDTALKLADLTKLTFDDEGEVVMDSVTSLVTELKESDAILFNKAAMFDTKRPGDTTTIVRPKMSREEYQSKSHDERLKLAREGVQII